MIRRLAATALVIALLGGGATGAAAQGTDTTSVPVSSDNGPPVGTMLLLFAAITVAWALLAVVVMRRQRRRRHRPIGVLQARPRRGRMPSPAGETGGFVPMASVTAPPEEESAEEELDDDDGWTEPLETEPEPAGPFTAYDRRPVAEPVPQDLPVPVRQLVSQATTYEIVWYRDEARVHFALQPVDGRSASWAKVHSDTFTWAEDADPPADLRDAQRAHGRLRARLVREGWRPAGRGERWFSHRFRPPPRP
jgi:hypothetical protein